MNLSTPENLAVIDHLLTTTRSVRKRLDLERPVEPEMIEKCLDLATQAPTGSNLQAWSFMVVTDEEKKMKIANLYRKAWAIYTTPPEEEVPTPEGQSDVVQMERIMGSAAYLAEYLHKVPVFIIPCHEDFPGEKSTFVDASLYGSILPATWSLMLALRARGLGSAWTTLHLMFEKEANEILGVPEGVNQVALLPVAYFTGEDFKPAKRLPISNRTFWNSWGEKR